MAEPNYHLSGIIATKEQEYEDFHGPLDVILQLLAKHKIEIQDISITSILEQYLSYLEQMRQLDMEIASSFIAMASHLMMIKTKMLLSYSEQQEALSEMEDLIRALEERQQKEAYGHIEKAFPFLEAQYDLGSGRLTKEQEPLKRDNTYQYVHDLEDMIAALMDVMARSKTVLPPPTANFVGIVGVEPYSIGKKSGEIMDRLKQLGTLGFSALFETCGSRSEVVATFLAILELCKDKGISLDEDWNVSWIET